jgi:hypothetical protein
MTTVSLHRTIDEEAYDSTAAVVPTAALEESAVLEVKNG